MRTIAPRRVRARLASESGQTTLFVLVGLGIFLLGAVGFAVDIADLWFHRQAAQNAADAACTAASMDMLFTAQGITVPTPETSWGNLPSPPTAGTTYNCGTPPSNTLPAAAPCKYALLNGYDG